MTYEEIEKAFASEWVFLEDPETTPMLQVTAGKVLWHSKDREEVYAKALELRPKSSAILFLGKIRRNMDFVL